MASKEAGLKDKIAKSYNSFEVQPACFTNSL
jgi:hypothetical protein